MSPRTRPQSRETLSPNFRILTIRELDTDIQRVNWEVDLLAE
jgi:hypothetical protein